MAWASTAWSTRTGGPGSMKCCRQVLVSVQYPPALAHQAQRQRSFSERRWPTVCPKQTHGQVVPNRLSGCVSQTDCMSQTDCVSQTDCLSQTDCQVVASVYQRRPIHGCDWRVSDRRIRRPSTGPGRAGRRATKRRLARRCRTGVPPSMIRAIRPPRAAGRRPWPGPETCPVSVPDAVSHGAAKRFAPRRSDAMAVAGLRPARAGGFQMNFFSH